MVAAVALCGIAAVGLAAGLRARAADQAANDAPANYLVGSQVCGACHADKMHQFSATPHYSLVTDPRWKPADQGCEACHGPGGNHTHSAGAPGTIFNPRKATAAEVAARCTVCHDAQAIRRRPNHVEHDPDTVSCNDCHSPHQDATNPFLLINDPPALCFRCHKEVESDFRKPFHHKVLEGGISCRDCHSGHGPQNTAEARRSAEGLTTLCVRCHADKHGPFVFEHQAITRTEEGCVTCHNPHGSGNNRMLKRNTVFQICIQCHTEIGLSGDATKGVFSHDLGSPRFQNCTVCHTQIHGSNTSRVFLN